MNIACVQFDIAWENKAANFEKVAALLRATDVARGSLVLLPEMFATGFSMNVAAIAEEQGGVTEQWLANTAREFGVFLMAGHVTRGGDARGRNECVAFAPDGRLIARYRKLQPFTLAGEGACYEPGDAPLIFTCHDVTVAPFICYDLRFPEWARAAARSRPQVMTFIANWPTRRVHHWCRLLQARAIENQCFVAAVNRIGTDPLTSYPGRSLIIDPHGEILCDAGDREAVIQATLDLAALAEYRRGFPALEDMRSR